MLSEDARHEAALALAKAERDRQPIAPLSEAYPAFEVAIARWGRDGQGDHHLEPS